MSCKVIFLHITIFLFVGVFCPYAAGGQSLSTCNCAREFSFLRSYIEKNYPGFNDKTPGYGNVDYKKNTSAYEAKTAAEKNPTYCIMLLREWLKYFKDDHLQIAPNETDENDSMLLIDRISGTEKITIPASLIAKIKESQGVEGVYYRDDSLYKVAVIKHPNSWRTYAAVVLESKNKNWEPGMVKFEMKEKNDSSFFQGRQFFYLPSIFYDNDHGIRMNKIMSFSGYGLDGGIWKKEGWKESEEEQNERNRARESRKDNTRANRSFIEFSQPSADVAYLRISTFGDRYVHTIDSFIAAHDDLISKTRHLIIDVRNNGGGSDRSFEKLLPYIYTNPIITVGMAALATTDNIEAAARRAKTVSPEIRKLLEDEVLEMKQHRGRYTPLDNDTLTLESVKKYPEKVAILINGNCASTTEQFLLAAQQSKKVVIMGTHSNGTLDYSNKRPKPFPCLPYTLEYPITRTGRLPSHPIDNIGITPDILLDVDSDWIKEATGFLKK